MEKLILKDEDSGGGSSSSLKAYIDDGVFIIEGNDSGQSVKEFYGDWDYEYWIKVQDGEYPEDILSLIGEFSSYKEIMAWMNGQGIEYEYTSWV